MLLLLPLGAAAAAAAAAYCLLPAARCLLPAACPLFPDVCCLLSAVVVADAAGSALCLLSFTLFNLDLIVHYARLARKSCSLAAADRKTR